MIIHNFKIEPKDAVNLHLRVFRWSLLEHQILWALKVKNADSVSIHAPTEIISDLNARFPLVKKLQSLGLLRLVESSSNQASNHQSISDFMMKPTDKRTIRDKADLDKFKSDFTSGLRAGAAGLIAPSLNKRLSIPVSLVLSRLRVSPNAISLAALMFTFLGGWLFVAGTHPFWPFLCFQINSLLDGCDGEVAKMNFSFTDFGKKLDVYSDYLTTLVIFGFGGWYFHDKGFPLTLWVLSLALLVATAGLWPVYGLFSGRKLIMENVEGVFHAKMSHPRNWPEKIERAALDCSRRDFYIFAMFLLSLSPYPGVIPYWMMFLAASWLFFSIHTLLLDLKSPSSL